MAGNLILSADGGNDRLFGYIYIYIKCARYIWSLSTFGPTWGQMYLVTSVTKYI